MISLKLIKDSWDIQLDENGLLLVADADYSIAQNVATAVRLFTNDAYFDTRSGIPHFQITYIRNPNLSVIRSRIKATAEAVVGVASATVILNPLTEAGTLSGVINLKFMNNVDAEVTL